MEKLVIVTMGCRKQFGKINLKNYRLTKYRNIREKSMINYSLHAHINFTTNGGEGEGDTVQMLSMLLILTYRLFDASNKNTPKMGYTCASHMHTNTLQ